MTNYIINDRNGAALFTFEFPHFQYLGTLKLPLNTNIPDSEKKRLAVEWALKNNQSLKNADLSGADLHYLNLEDADLSDTNLEDADLSYTNMKNTDLSLAKMTGANMTATSLEGANLRVAEVPLSIATSFVDETTDLAHTRIKVKDGDMTYLVTANIFLDNEGKIAFDSSPATIVRIQSDMLTETVISMETALKIRARELGIDPDHQPMGKETHLAKAGFEVVASGSMHTKMAEARQEQIARNAPQSTIARRPTQP